MNSKSIVKRNIIWSCNYMCASYTIPEKSISPSPRETILVLVISCQVNIYYLIII